MNVATLTIEGDLFGSVSGEFAADGSALPVARRPKFREFRTGGVIGGSCEPVASKPNVPHSFGAAEHFASHSGSKAYQNHTEPENLPRTRRRFSEGFSHSVSVAYQ